MSKLTVVREILAEAARALHYERSRALAPHLAVRPWLLGQQHRWQRLRRMGLADFGGLQRLEVACAQVGLVYPPEDPGQVVPWHLPERFWQLRTMDLPSHPVIDASAADSPVAAQAGQARAVYTLARLADLQTWSERWGVVRRSPPAPKARIAVCLHLFYPELWPGFREQLKCIPEPFDLYVSVPVFAAGGAWREVLRDEERVQFMPVVNRGRDLAPWLAWLRSGALDGYDAVCKLHGKRSLHISGGDAWREVMVRALVGSRDNVTQIIERFRADPDLALLGPASMHRELAQTKSWNKYRQNLARLAPRLGMQALVGTDTFFAGTMFWFRPQAFDRLRHSDLSPSDFALEMGQIDDTLAHFLERLLVALAVQTGSHVLAWQGEPEPALAVSP